MPMPCATGRKKRRAAGNAIVDRKAIKHDRAIYLASISSPSAEAWLANAPHRLIAFEGGTVLVRPQARVGVGRAPAHADEPGVLKLAFNDEHMFLVRAYVPIRDGQITPRSRYAHAPSIGFTSPSLPSLVHATSGSASEACHARSNMTMPVTSAAPKPASATNPGSALTAGASGSTK